MVNLAYFDSEDVSIKTLLSKPYIPGIKCIKPYKCLHFKVSPKPFDKSNKTKPFPDSK